MKLLLDENLPIKIKRLFSKKHEVKTVSEKGWAGKQNGELLGLMTVNEFEGFVTLDKNLIYQQNIDKFEITIFILRAVNNKISTLKPFIKQFEQLNPEDFKERIVQIIRD